MNRFPFAALLATSLCAVATPMTAQSSSYHVAPAGEIRRELGLARTIEMIRGFESVSVQVECVDDGLRVSVHALIAADAEGDVALSVIPRVRELLVEVYEVLPEDVSILIEREAADNAPPAVSTKSQHQTFDWVDLPELEADFIPVC